MKKQIAQAQTEAIMAELIKCNIPVQSYSAIQQVFDSCPVIEEKTEEAKVENKKDQS